MAADDVAADAADGAYHCAGHRSNPSFRGYVSMLRGHCQIWGVSGSKRSIFDDETAQVNQGLIDLRAATNSPPSGSLSGTNGTLGGRDVEAK